MEILMSPVSIRKWQGCHCVDFDKPNFILFPTPTESYLYRLRDSHQRRSKRVAMVTFKSFEND